MTHFLHACHSQSLEARSAAPLLAQDTSDHTHRLFNSPYTALLPFHLFTQYKTDTKWGFMTL